MAIIFWMSSKLFLVMFADILWSSRTFRTCRKCSRSHEQWLAKIYIRFAFEQSGLPSAGPAITKETDNLQNFGNLFRRWRCWFAKCDRHFKNCGKWGKQMFPYTGDLVLVVPFQVLYEKEDKLNLNLNYFFTPYDFTRYFWPQN